MLKQYQSSPLEYLTAFAIVFVAGAASTAIASAYSKYVSKQAERNAAEARTEQPG